MKIDPRELLGAIKPNRREFLGTAAGLATPDLGSSSPGGYTPEQAEGLLRAMLSDGDYSAAPGFYRTYIENSPFSPSPMGHIYQSIHGQDFNNPDWGIFHDLLTGYNNAGGNIDPIHKKKLLEMLAPAMSKAEPRLREKLILDLRQNNEWRNFESNLERRRAAERATQPQQSPETSINVQGSGDQPMSEDLLLRMLLEQIQQGDRRPPSASLPEIEQSPEILQLLRDR